MEPSPIPVDLHDIPIRSSIIQAEISPSPVGSLSVGFLRVSKPPEISSSTGDASCIQIELPSAPNAMSPSNQVQEMEVEATS